MEEVEADGVSVLLFQKNKSSEETLRVPIERSK